MFRSFRNVATALLAVSIWNPLAADAQTITPQGKLFRLTPNSSYADGCINSPCDCLVRRSGRMAGMMRVGKPVFMGTVIEFPITEVNWWATFADGSEVFIKGKGTFRAISGFAGWIRELEFHLSIDGRDPIRVFGGENTDSGGLNLRMFPPISGDIDACLGVRIALDAIPEILMARCFELQRGSQFSEGCLDPCTCPIAVAPLRGRFGLVELDRWNNVREFAVVRVRLVAALDSQSPVRAYKGFGKYIRDEGATPPMQRMVLALTTDGQNFERFDSGLVDATDTLAPLKISLANNGFRCFNTVLDIKAARCRVCPDVTRNGVVDFGDISTVLGAWGASYEAGSGPGDCNQDGAVNFSDITMVLSHWLERCERW